MLGMIATAVEYEPTYTYVNYGSSGFNGFFSGNGFYVGMSVLCLLVAAWLLYTKAYKYSLLKKVCNYPVQARMFSVDYKHGGKGGRFWNITYEFFYNEKRYLVNNDIWERIGHYYVPKEGDEVGILINPMNPNEIYDLVVKGGRNTGIFAGILFVCLGLFIFFMPYFT